MEGANKMIDYKSLSLANQVFETIEKNILDGVYNAGEVISESKLSEELGVSRTPIREALSRLESERLISTTPSGTVDVHKRQGMIGPDGMINQHPGIMRFHVIANSDSSEDQNLKLEVLSLIHI